MKLYVEGRQDPVRARVTLSPDRRTAKLNPRRNLRRGKVYTLKLSRAITDRRGNKLRATKWRARSR